MGNAGYAKEYRGKVEAELNKICGTILNVLDEKLIPKATSGESKVFYQKMKADYYRYIAEFTNGDEKTKASESARVAYAEAAATPRTERQSSSGRDPGGSGGSPPSPSQPRQQPRR